MQDLTTLPPETFFRLAVERGGLDLEEVVRDLSPEAAAALRQIAAAPEPDSTSKAAPSPKSRSSSGPEPDRSAEPPMTELARYAMRAARRSVPEPVARDATPSSPAEEPEPTRDARPRQRLCPSCGFPGPAGDHFCRRCGAALPQPAAAITMDDMVEAEQITAEQADELQRRLLDLQLNYPAGARYSIFGGPS